MNLHLMIVADHLNKIQAGKPTSIGLTIPGDRNSASFSAEKTAIALICVGFGLARGIKLD